MVHHVTDTVRPSEVGLMYGGNLSSTSAVMEIGRISDTQSGLVPDTSGWISSASTRNLIRPEWGYASVSVDESIGFRLPNNFVMGIYGFRISVGSDKSDIYYLNRPDPWWIQGDDGTEATVGGWIKIMGKCLAYDGNQSKISLRQSGTEVYCFNAQADKENVLELSVPDTVSAGNYEIYVHNGYGGDIGWVSAGNFTIKAADNTEKTVFNAVTYGADPTGAADSTVAIQNALNAAGAVKGAVYLPSGSYKVTDSLKLSPDTTLYGDGMNVSILFVPVGQSIQSADGYVLNGNNAPMKGATLHDFGIYTQGAHRNVLRAGGRFIMDHVLIRAVAYYGHKNVKEVPEGSSVPAVTTDFGTGSSGVLLKDADNFQITNCDIRATSYALNIFCAKNGLLKNNKLHGGVSPMQSYGMVRDIFEGNEFKTVGLYGSGNVLSLFYCAASYNVLMRENTFRDIYGGDREAITLDGHGTAYFGTMESVSGKEMTLTEAPFWGADANANKDMITIAERDAAFAEYQSKTADQEWHGVTVYIVDGKGVGQYRNLVACDGANVTLDRAWDVEPDSTSKISIGKFNGRHIFLSNEFYDAGTGVQLYPPNVECIVAYNYMERSGDTLSGGNYTAALSATGKPRVEPGWFSMFLYNTVAEGNGFGRMNTGLKITGDSSSSDIKISRGHVVKWNNLQNNAAIFVNGAAADVVINKNTIENCDPTIYYGSPPSFIVKGLQVTNGLRGYFAN